MLRQHWMRQARSCYWWPWHPSLGQTINHSWTTHLSWICHITNYQRLISILWWCIKLGKVDIITEVTMLSSFLVNPRKGPFEQAFHIMTYLHLHTSLVFDDMEPDLSGFHFKKCDC
jgi:hypothetical protein